MTVHEITPPAPAAEVGIIKQAVLYLRVSTTAQLNTAIDIDPDGNSIDTQRKAGHVKAGKINANVIAEFVEPGNSAQSIEKRPVFRQMLAYVNDHAEIDYVIVYMRSRAFRNLGDAIITKRKLLEHGIRLVSAREDFGEGIWADAMEAITDIFNEIEVRRSGEDIKEKLKNKALSGGTIGRARLGYRNVRAELDGRLYNSVGLDDERAPLISDAFELYATGEYSLDSLQATMADLGLTTRPSKRWPQQQPVSTSKLHQMLRDPYYAGWVTYKGEIVQGRHQAIVRQDLFDRVQQVIDLRSKRGQRDRVLQHYLKGMLFCDRCADAGRTCRLIYTEVKGRGGTYGYYLCRGRQQGLCDLPHLPVIEVEDAIGRHYHSLQLGDDVRTAIDMHLTETVADQLQLTRDLHDTLRKQLAKLEAQERRLIDMAADGLLDRDKIIAKSNSIKIERARVQAGLDNTGAELTLGAERLTACLELVRDPHALYQQSPDSGRRLLNHAFYEALYLNDHPGSPLTVRDVPKPPFDEIRQASFAYRRQQELARQRRSTVRNQSSPRRSSEAAGTEAPVLADVFLVQGSSKRVMVELRGLEPLTPTLPAR